MQALTLFLDCCRHRAMQPLAAAARAGLSQPALQDLLTKLAVTVQVHPYTIPCTHPFSREHHLIIVIVLLIYLDTLPHS